MSTRPTSHLPTAPGADYSRPCADCNGDAILIASPAPNGARIAVLHEPGCPFYAQWANEREAQA
ncbi:hypothetical protein [Microbacterium sp. LWH10-1.2]|uniref:hypothetical protein n=1 Tax=Microbacterium sp. LWH10-1.2 TaxID=3135255 RepID=UPI00313A4350